MLLPNTLGTRPAGFAKSSVLDRGVTYQKNFKNNEKKKNPKLAVV